MYIGVGESLPAFLFIYHLEPYSSNLTHSFPKHEPIVEALGPLGISLLHNLPKKYSI